MKMPISTPILLIGLSFCLVACEDKASTSTSSTPGPVPKSTANAKPDNPAQNHPDNKTREKTPVDQLENKSDVTISSEIRKSIMKSETMSINGQNVKIISENGVVTLRGPVATQAEKDTIETLAKQTAGVSRVDNLLEVKTSP